jgi:hypothetical protein
LCFQPRDVATHRDHYLSWSHLPFHWLLLHHSKDFYETFTES